MTMEYDDANARSLGEEIESKIQANPILLGRSLFPVYKVILANGEEVAVKKIPHPSVPPGENQIEYNKFKREWEIQYKLYHPNVLGLRAIGISGDFKYLVMDLCAGSLDQTYSPNYGGPALPPPLRVLHEIASGVAYLHNQDLIHRDIKPQNILLSRDNPVRMKVADYGHSKSTTPETGTCSWSGGFGTLDYHSAEYAEWQDEFSQAIKRNKPLPKWRTSNKVDVFSTGIVFFEVLSRGHQHPFGNGVLVTSNIATGETVDFDERLQGIPESVKNLIRRMIDLNPVARPTMMEVEEELERLLNQ